jgi:hypothetical protein
MKFFAISILIDEYRFYDITGNIFFILKEKNGKYYTSQLFKYNQIVEELKEWSIEIIQNNSKIELEDMSFSYNKIIKPMFRDNKLKQLGI